MDIKIDGFRKFGIAGILLYLMWTRGIDAGANVTLLIVASSMVVIFYYALNFAVKWLFRDRSTEDITTLTTEYGAPDIHGEIGDEVDKQM